MNEQEIFEAALERDPQQRDAYLHEACGDDSWLRQRVDELLQLHERAGSYFEKPAAEIVATVQSPYLTEAIGTMVGPYKLREQIGEGGMGVVYVAEQLRPVRRKVALKVIKPGMDTKQVIARFEAERQALALMDHPNIARVLDAGAADSGRPYFVMEFVRGIPITEYSDKARLTPRKRLELFILVCQAVQHAHQKGIIHRDIKPSNVLVTLHDSVPVPKVIDFGVAKAINQQLTQETVYTRSLQMVGTPLYMSPEQAELSGLDIDTRTDVYSLGVLLYELLTGSTPFDKETIRKAGYDEIRRIIREEEPRKPSTLISTLGASLTTVSEQRDTDPRKLTQTVRGELDWIVMKALEKDRTRRYESASALASDVRAHLNEKPLQHACPPSATYKFRKFARRNKRALISASVVAISLLVGIVISTWQAVCATRESGRATSEAARAARAEELALSRLESERQALKKSAANLLLASQAADDLFVLATNKWRLYDMTEEVSRETALDRLLRFHRELAAQPCVDALSCRMQGIAWRRLADLEGHLGDPEAGQASYEEAIAVFNKLVNDHPHEAIYKMNLASTFLRLQDEEGYRQAVEVLRALISDESATTVAAEGHDHGGAFLDWDCDCFGHHRFLLAYSLHQLALQLMKSGDRIEEAESCMREAIGYWKPLTEEFPEVARHRWGYGDSLGLLGQSLESKKRMAAAGEQYRQAEKQLRKAVELDSQSGFALSSLARQLSRMGKHADATTEWKKVVELYPDDVDAARLYWDGYWTWARIERDPEKHRSWLERQLAQNPKDTSLMDSVASFLAHYQGSERLDPKYALRLAQEAVKHDPENGKFLDTLAGAWAANGNWEEAARAFEKAISFGNWRYSKNNFALMLLDCPELSVRDPKRALELAEESLVKGSGASWNSLGHARYRNGDWPGAIEALGKAESLEYFRKARNWFFLAMAHWQTGEKEKARKIYDKADSWMRSNQPSGAGFPTDFFRTEAATLLGITGELRLPLSNLYGGVAQSHEFSTIEPGTLVTVDPETGAVPPLSVPTPRPDSTTGINGLAFNSKGELFASVYAPGGRNSNRYKTPPTLIRIDPESGRLLEIVGVIRTADGNPVKMSDLAMQPATDLLFGVSATHDWTVAPGHVSTARLYAIDVETAVATLVGDTGLEFGGGLAFAPDGTLYQASFRGPRSDTLKREPRLFTLDPKAGRIIRGVPLAGPQEVESFRYVVSGLAVRPSDGVIFASGSTGGNQGADSDIDSLLATIEPDTGIVTHLGPSPNGIGEKMGDLAFRPQPTDARSEPRKTAVLKKE